MFSDEFISIATEVHQTMSAGYVDADRVKALHSRMLVMIGEDDFPVTGEIRDQFVATLNAIGRLVKSIKDNPEGWAARSNL